MKPIILLTVIFISLSLPAYADWSAPGAQPGMSPNLAGHRQFQGPAHVNINAPRLEHHTQIPAVQTRPVTPQHLTPPQHTPSTVRREDNRDRHLSTPGYFRRDTEYYGQAQVIFPDVDISPTFNVPDGFETVVVNGEVFYYHMGVFYQQVGDQLNVIPPVLGAIVDSIPEDYQIVMADGTHYLFTGGVYYQRVEEGFEVVPGPGSDQE